MATEKCQTFDENQLFSESFKCKMLQFFFFGGGGWKLKKENIPFPEEIKCIAPAFCGHSNQYSLMPPN